jgi:hypothetical protein
VSRYFVIVAAGTPIDVRTHIERKHGAVRKVVLYDSPARTHVYGVMELDRAEPEPAPEGQP